MQATLAAPPLITTPDQRVAQKPISDELAPAARDAFQPAPLKLTVLPLCVQLAFHIWLMVPLTAMFATQVTALALLLVRVTTAQ